MFLFLFFILYEEVLRENEVEQSREYGEREFFFDTQYKVKIWSCVGRRKMGVKMGVSIEEDVVVFEFIY